MCADLAHIWHLESRVRAEHVQTGFQPDMSKLDFSLKVATWRVWLESCVVHGRKLQTADSQVWQDSAGLAPNVRKPAESRKVAILQISADSAESRLFAKSCDSAGLAPNSCQDLKKSSGPAKPGFQVLYIDHFQLPPRWKMTGQTGDPFRGRR